MREGWSILQTWNGDFVLKRHARARKLLISKGRSAGGGNICRERERDLINAIFRVVDSVARFLYKIYNCVLDKLL